MFSFGVVGVEVVHVFIDGVVCEVGVGEEDVYFEVVDACHCVLLSLCIDVMPFFVVNVGSVVVLSISSSFFVHSCICCWCWFWLVV